MIRLFMNIFIRNTDSFANKFVKHILKLNHEQVKIYLFKKDPCLRGSAAFLQTLNKYVSYCFDVGSAAVLRDQDWNAMAKEESFEQVVIEGITVRTPSI